MDLTEAVDILGSTIQSDNHLYDRMNYTSWEKRDKTITLDGEFSADELEAMAIWMRAHYIAKED